MRASQTSRVGGQRLVDALVDVLAAERFGGRGEHRDFVDAGGERALEAREVRDERRVARARPPRDAGEHLGGVGHLRHPLRADERRHFDHRQARRAQAVDERDLVGGRHERALVLQPVARPDFDDRHVISVMRSGRLDSDCLDSYSNRQHRIGLHELAFAAVYRGDDGVAGCANRQLHLHRLEHDDVSPFFTRVPGLTSILMHRRRHRRGQRSAGRSASPHGGRVRRVDA